MSASKQDIQDLQFIFEEGIRLRRLLNVSYDSFYEDFENDIESMAALLDPPKNLKDIDYTLQFYISSKARRRFEAMAKRQLNTMEGISLDELIKELKNSFYLHIKNASSFDERGCQKLISRAHNRVRRTKKEITYYIAFNAPSLNPDKEISISSVKIVNKNYIYEKVKEDSYYDIFVENEVQSFNCLLCIPISNSSTESSKRRAINVAKFIYGVIKVFTTSYQFDARRLHLLGQSYENDITHYIASEDDKYGIEGNIKFGGGLEGFWTLFEADLMTDIGKVIKRLIEISISPTNQEILADRLIDSFIWFGDATTDSNERGQIIKLVTAMERLVTLSNTGITENFCNRVACSIAIYHGEIDKWKDYANTIYDLRSKIVHGRKSLYKDDDELLTFCPFSMCYRSILSTCILFYKIDLELANYDERLQKAYNGLVEHCKDEKYKVRFE